MKNMTVSIQKQVEQAITILKQGGIVACPTDTVYGVGALAFEAEAIEKIYPIKNRSAGRCPSCWPRNTR